MKLFSIAKGFGQEEEHARESENLKNEGDNFKIASDGGYIVALKYALFVLFGYYNARLFITTVPGWEGFMTAAFALTGEATALYCFNNYKRSEGKHKTALGVFALLLLVFSFTHASISFFKMEQGNMSDGIKFYCEHIAFPLLFGLLLLAAIIIPLMHWRTGVAAEQAKAKAEIEKNRAQAVAKSANFRLEATVAREQLANLEERIGIESEYVDRLSTLGSVKKRARQVLALFDDDPELQRQLSGSFGIPGTSLASTPEPKRVHGLTPKQQTESNLQSSNFYIPEDDAKK